MILSDVKRYLIKHKRASLEDLAVHFESQPDAMRSMLTQWIRKGRVAKMETQACGGSCSKCCCDAAVEIYEWKQ